MGLDVTRGFAVMGILAMNIIAFAMPENAYITPVSWGGTAPADMAEWAIAFIFFDSKMRGLFSILFGASSNPPSPPGAVRNGPIMAAWSRSCCLASPIST